VRLLISDKLSVTTEILIIALKCRDWHTGVDRSAHGISGTKAKGIRQAITIGGQSLYPLSGISARFQLK
jgi:hypothetical protein